MSTEAGRPYTGPWYEGRNKRRRENYHSDDSYREVANKQARDGYRHTKGVGTPFDPRTNLPHIATFGTVRTYEGNAPSRPNDGLSFSKGEVALIFDRPAKQIQQWSSDGRIPPTIHRAKVEGKERNWIDVYTRAEVVAIVNALGPLLSDLIYFRRDHVDTITAVHLAVEEVRA